MEGAKTKAGDLSLHEALRCSASPVPRCLAEGDIYLVLQETVLEFNHHYDHEETSVRQEDLVHEDEGGVNYDDDDAEGSCKEGE